MDLDVLNGNSGLNDVIAAATGSDTNFALRLTLSDVNLGTGAVDTLGLGYVTPQAYPAGVTTAALLSGGTNLWDALTANVMLTDAACPYVKYLCAVLYKGSATTWSDASTMANSGDLASNTTCKDVSAIADKICRNGKYELLESYIDSKF